MAFWSDITGTPEPLRQYRWYLLFGSGNFDDISYALMECGKPEMEVTMSEHLLLNHYFKYPGVVKWKPINIKFASVVDGKDFKKNASRIFHHLFVRSGYTVPYLEQSNHINKTNMIESISTRIEIVQIDADGKHIEKWALFNPLITNVKYGNLSYSSDDIVTIEATINYDFAELFQDINRNGSITDTYLREEPPKAPGQ